MVNHEREFSVQFLLGGRWLLLLCVFGACCGCGGREPGVRRGRVEGEVTWNGIPVADGVVLFVPQGAIGLGSSPVPTQVVQGKYMLGADDGPIVGQHRVEVRATRKTGKKTREPSAAMKRFDPTLKSVELTEQYLPARFNSPSTLTREVQAGENLIDFHLTDN